MGTAMPIANQERQVKEHRCLLQFRLSHSHLKQEEELKNEMKRHQKTKCQQNNMYLDCTFDRLWARASI